MAKQIALLVILVCLAAILTAQMPEVFVQRGHGGSIRTMSVSPDGKRILTGGGDEIAILWDLHTGKEIRHFMSGHVNNVAFSPDGKSFMAYERYSGTMRFWNTSTGEILREFQANRGTHRVDDLSFLSPDGKKVLMTASYDRQADKCFIQLLDSTTGSVYRHYDRNDLSVYNRRIDAYFTPEGDLALWDLLDKKLKIIDYHRDTEVVSLQLNAADLQAVSFSNDSRYALLVCEEIKAGKTFSSLQLWDLSLRKQEWIINYTNTIPYAGMNFLPDGKSFLLAFRDYKNKQIKIEVKNTLKGDTIRQFTIGTITPGDASIGTSTYGSISITPDGLQLITGSDFKVISMYDLQSGQKVRSYQSTGKILVPTIFNDARHILIGNKDEQAKLWDLTLGREISALGVPGESLEFQYLSPDLRYLLKKRQGEAMQLWDYQTGRLLTTFPPGVEYYGAPVCSKDGKYIYFGYNEDYHPETERLWGSLHKYEISTGKKMFDIEVHTDYQSDDPGGGTETLISPDGKYLIFWLGDSYIRIYDSTTGNLLSTLGVESGGLYLWQSPIIISPNGKELAAICGDGPAGIWDIASGKKIHSFMTLDRPRSACFTPDGKQLIVGADNTSLKLWDIASGKEIRDFKGHLSGVNGLSISADEKVLLSKAEDGMVKLWDLASGKEIAQYVFFEDGEWVCLTPEGYYNASENGAQNLNVRIDNSIYSMDNFFDTYFRPDLVKAKIEGRDLALLANASFQKGVKTPPEMSMSVMTVSGSWESFSRAAENIMISDGCVRIRIEGKDTGGGLKETRLFRNSKLVETGTRGLVAIPRYDYSQEYVVALTSGENVLMVLGYSEDMIQSNPVQAVVTYTPARLIRPDVYILAVAINSYQNSRYNLNYCVDDGKGFLDALHPRAGKLFGKVFAYTFYDDQASKGNIVSQLNRIVEKAKPDDVFILYYAGHGIAIPNEADESEFFFVLPTITQMTDLQQCRNNGISAVDLRELVRRIKATKQMMFIDACNSGSFAESFAFRGAAEENALAKLSRATGTAIYAATTSEQFASEVKELGHGIFTFSLIEAMSGKALNAEGQITNNSLKSYLDIRIPQLSKQYKTIEQYPTTFSIGQEFPIGLP